MNNEDLYKSLQDMRTESCTRLAEALRRGQDIRRYASLPQDIRQEIIIVLKNAAPELVEHTKTATIKALSDQLLNLGIPGVIVRANFSVCGYGIPDEEGVLPDEKEFFNDYVKWSNNSNTMPNWKFNKLHPRVETQKAVSH